MFGEEFLSFLREYTLVFTEINYKTSPSGEAQTVDKLWSWVYTKDFQ